MSRPFSLVVNQANLRVWLPVILYAGMIFLFSSIPGKEVPSFVFGRDHLLHFLEYLPFGILVARAVSQKRIIRGTKPLFFSFLLVILYAFSDEFHQTFVSCRFCTFIDAVSDIFGATIGILIYLWRK